MLEMTVALSILGLAVGLVGSSVFQVLSVQQTWQDDAVSKKDLRHAESWFAGDALNAKSTNLVDGSGQVNSLMFTTWDGDQITYGITGSSLMRSAFDGTQTAVTELADDVTFIGFSRSGRVLDFRLEVEAERDTSNTIDLQTYLR